VSVGKISSALLLSSSERELSHLHATPAIPSPPSARAHAHLLKNVPLEKGSKGAPARGRWVAKLRRRGKVGGGQKRRRRCAKDRKQIVFIFIELNKIKF
jgi:hypothetical protein